MGFFINLRSIPGLKKIITVITTLQGDKKFYRTGNHQRHIVVGLRFLVLVWIEIFISTVWEFPYTSFHSRKILLGRRLGIKGTGIKKDVLA